MKNILILYAGIGHGHKKIAENIAAVLKTDNSVDLSNLMQMERGQLSEGGSKLYFWILKHAPRIWDFFYTNNVFLNLMMPLRRLAAKFKSQAVQELLARNKYDLIISTHVNSSAVISYLKLKNIFQGKFIITFSDFHLNKFWLFDNADLYLANIQEQKNEMIKLGIPEDKILVCGITIPPKEAIQTPLIRAGLGIPLEEKIILVMSGSFGFELQTKTIEKIKNTGAYIIVVCGSNEVARKTISETYKHNKKIIVLGYVANLSELYAIANVVITKPGGLSTTECLQNMLPIIVEHFLPGQEKLNFDYLLKNNLVLDGRHNLGKAVEHELGSGNFVAQLRNNPNRLRLIGDGSIINNHFKVL